MLIDILLSICVCPLMYVSVYFEGFMILVVLVQLYQGRSLNSMSGGDNKMWREKERMSNRGCLNPPQENR